jgi:DNA-binding response OmpR family regulator
MARILVVDDDPDILKLADKILTDAGHSVTLAEDALRAVDCLNNATFDLLLSDANMPQFSGFDLVNTVRSNPKYNAMNIAMLTGLRERADVERALKLGVDDYIVKPLDPMLLVQKVNSMCDKRGSQKLPEVTLSPSQGRAQMRRQITVEKLSEMGIQVLTEDPVKPGQVLDVSAEIFKTLDIQAPPMKVLRTELDPGSGQYRSQLVFVGARESVLQKIRRWLYSHGAGGKMAS